MEYRWCECCLWLLFMLSVLIRLSAKAQCELYTTIATSNAVLENPESSSPMGPSE